MYSSNNLSTKVYTFEIIIPAIRILQSLVLRERVLVKMMRLQCIYYFDIFLACVTSPCILDSFKKCCCFYLCRSYIQPQWVFDCVNLRRLLPVDDYSPGTHLPPHLSPFTEEGPGDYIPPERAQAIAQDAEEIPGEIIESEEEDLLEDSGV